MRFRHMVTYVDKKWHNIAIVLIHRSSLFMKKANPNPEDVVKFRKNIQSHFDIGITSAQDHCAELLFTSRRTWQQWENGDRKMHPAFWELACIKKP